MQKCTEQYLEQAQAVLSAAAQEQVALEKASLLIAEAYSSGHHIYIFGCTHSAILCEDVFYRAGAPAFWRPLWGPGMSITTTPGILTSAVEHSEEIGRQVIRCSRAEKEDVLVVASTSGKNGAPVAVAEEALSRGMKLIIITSSAYRNEKGNHSRLPNLWALADKAVIIDNHVPMGDASIRVGECPMGPVSTIAGSFLMHTLSALAVEKITEKGLLPPVFLSSNAPGGLAHNTKLMENPDLREAYLLP